MIADWRNSCSVVLSGNLWFHTWNHIKSCAISYITGQRLGSPTGFMTFPVRVGIIVSSLGLNFALIVCRSAESSQFGFNSNKRLKNLMYLAGFWTPSTQRIFAEISGVKILAGENSRKGKNDATACTQSLISCWTELRLHFKWVLKLKLDHDIRVTKGQKY